MVGDLAGGPMAWDVGIPTPFFGVNWSRTATTKWGKFVLRGFLVLFGMEAHVIGPFHNNRKGEFAHLKSWAVHSLWHGKHFRH